MSPLVSILIPTYNRERLVAECIASAQAQTYPDIEIIVCDNASADRTWTVIQDMARRDRRIRAFRNDSNLGPVRNWLRCLSEARGQYVKILFSDDLMAPDYLERLVPLMADPQVAFAYSAARIGPDYASGLLAYRNGEQGAYAVQRYFALLSIGRVPLSPGAGLFRTSDARKNLCDCLPTTPPREFWRHGAGPDVILYALTASAYPKVAVDEGALVLFRAHAGSITAENTNNAVRDGYLAALSWFFRTHLGQAAWRDYLAYQWLLQIAASKRVPGLLSYLRTYEGRGTLSEGALVLLRALILGVRKMLSKLRLAASGTP